MSIECYNLQSTTTLPPPKKKKKNCFLYSLDSRKDIANLHMFVSPNESCVIQNTVISMPLTCLIF